MTVDAAPTTTGPVTTRQSSRGLALVVGVLVGALALAAGLWLGRATAPEPPLSAPVFGTSDGLPDTVVSGGRYTAELTVALADDWARWVDEAGRTDVIALALVGDDTSPNGDILCSGTVVPGSAVTLRCPITITATTGTTMSLEFGVGDVVGVEGGGGSAARMYTHTVS